MKNIGVEVAAEHGFGRAFLEGVSDYAARKCDARLCSTTLQRAGNQPKLDGMIVRLLDPQSHASAVRSGIPIVDIYGKSPRRSVAIVRGDYAAIAALAADNFLTHGHEHIGWCGISGQFFSDGLGRLFAECVHKSGKPFYAYDCPASLSGVITCNAPDRIPDRSALRKWIAKIPKPCAVFCCNDHRAFQLMRIASECGIAVPEEVSILGVDNDTTICAFADIPLSSIDPDAFRIGRTAARVLDAMMSNPVQNKLHPPVLVAPRGLVERQSTQHFPASPAWLSDVLLAIDRRLSDGINVGGIVAIAGRSAPVVERVFKEKFGVSVITYLTQQRMARAKKMIDSGQTAMKKIALACGFSSQQYFNRVYKAHYGHAPSDRPGQRT